MHHRIKCNFLLVLTCLCISLGYCDETHGNASSHSDHLNGHHGNDSDVHDHHGNDSHHGNESHGDHGHHGIHVASWNLDYVRQPLHITLFLIVSAICKLGFHHANFLSSIVPESCLLIILGTIVGAILHAVDMERTMIPHFSPSLFFLFLLPPIILESAYSLHDRVFFDNLGTILLYAVVGTIINCFLLGPTLYGLAVGGAMGNITISLVQCFVFSSLIVAVDPVAVLAIFQEIGVNNVLYFLVFGESLLNDAVTVVLYNMMKTFNEMETVPIDQMLLGVASFFTISLGGLSIGIMLGLFTAFITKFTESVRVVEPLTVFALAYAAYLFAELFHFSGIISIIGCGLVQAQYAFHNISQKSLTTVTYFSKMLSATCDCVIFMFLGLGLVHDKHVWHAGFVLWTVLLCLLFRFMVVYLLTYIANRVYRLRKIDTEEQFIMAYGGLRGAVAFCLVAMLDQNTLQHKNMFETTTLAVIIFTVFIQGITIKPLVKLLRIQKEGKEGLSIYQEINVHVTDHVMAGIEEILGRHGSNYVREKLDYLDGRYLKNWLQRTPQTKDDCIMELYQQIALQLHYENVAGAADLQRYTSDMELYKPELSDKGALGSLAAQHPDLANQALILARRKSHMPPGGYKETASPARSPMGSPKPAQPRAKAGWSAVKAVVAFKSPSVDAEKQVSRAGRRKTIFSAIMGREEDDELKEEPTAHDIKRWLVQPPARSDYHKKYDRNLTHDQGTDLIHHLHEKQLRTARLRRASMAALSPYSSSEALSGVGDHMSHEPLDAITEEGNNGDAGPPLSIRRTSRNPRHMRLPRAKTMDAGGEGPRSPKGPKPISPLARSPPRHLGHSFDETHPQKYDDSHPMVHDISPPGSETSPLLPDTSPEGPISPDVHHLDTVAELNGENAQDNGDLTRDSDSSKSERRRRNNLSRQMAQDKVVKEDETKV